MKTEHFHELTNTVLSIKSNKDMNDFLKGILTPQELDEISMRLQIAKLLKEGVSQREIARKLNVGIATITRGSKEIKRGRFKYL